MSDKDDIYGLIELAKANDREALQYLVESNAGLVWSIVRRFQNRGCELEDLYQIGCIGLLKAINKFDSKFLVRFSTYAVPMIMGEIKRFLRDDGIIKVSRSLKETAGRARVVKESLIRELDREPSVKEIADRMKVPVDELVMALDAGCAPESLFSTVGEGDSSPVLLIDRIDGEASAEKVELIDHIALKQLLQNLKPREKQIIFLRYFKEKTQVQIAEMLGISQVQVSRIERRILDDLKKEIVER